MDLLNLLKEKLTPSIIDKLSGFLGETPEDISTAINASLPTMLGGVIQQGTTEAGASKVMDILQEGGHTGDVLDDMPQILESFDKTQLFITIGSNIFSHFFGNTSNLIIDKVASLSSIRKTSASSLLGLSAPLVLGSIGKIVQKEGLGISGLMELLKKQREDVEKALPPSIVAHIPLKTTTTQKAETVKIVEQNSQKKETKKEDSFVSKLFPWLLLAALALVAAYYLRGCEGMPSLSKTTTKQDTTSVSVMSDSSALLNELEPVKTPEKEIVPKEKETKNSEPKVETTKKVATIKEEVTPIKTEPKKEVTKNVDSNNNQSTTSLISGSWVNFSSNNFRSGNAELKNSTEIQRLANYLKQHRSAEITISGGSRLSEDRAYAIREKLYEKGIDISRINISSSQHGSNGSVAIRLSK
jgi:OmpA-OmpF porin, OOP family